MKKQFMYDSTSERVDEASIEIRFEKFHKIGAELVKEGFEFPDYDCTYNSVKIKDYGTNFIFVLHQNLSFWEIYRVIDVVDMILRMKEYYLISLRNSETK